VKECLTCEKVLPVSSFYKSSESNDGLTANCKKCSDKLNAASILSEITNQIGIGFPFSKKIYLVDLEIQTRLIIIFGFF